MNDNEKMVDDVEEYDENDMYITLTDDDGNEIHFEFIDEFPFEGKDYVVLLPYEETEDEVVILQVIHGEDDDEFISVEDEVLLNRIFDEFEKRCNEE